MNSLDTIKKTAQATGAMPAAKTIPTEPVGVDAGDWLAIDPPPLAPIVENLFEAADKVLIVGSSKSRKSFFTLQLALALASGKRQFLDWHIAGARRVVLLNLELKPAHLQRRLHAMAARMGITPEDLADRLQIFNLRGRMITPEMLLKWTRQHASEVFIADPVYKMLSFDADENSPAAWRPILAAFDTIAEQTGAAVVFVHHHGKGKIGDRDTRDRGAGSSVVTRDYVRFAASKSLGKLRDAR